LAAFRIDSDLEWLSEALADPLAACAVLPWPARLRAVFLVALVRPIRFATSPHLRRSRVPDIGPPA